MGSLIRTWTWRSWLSHEQTTLNKCRLYVEMVINLLYFTTTFTLLTIHRYTRHNECVAYLPSMVLRCRGTRNSWTETVVIIAKPKARINEPYRGILSKPNSTNRSSVISPSGENNSTKNEYVIDLMLTLGTVEEDWDGVDQNCSAIEAR